MTNTAPALLVKNYYRRVDNNDFPGLVDLFAADAIYERPGYSPICGHEALLRFYRDERVIESGEHHIEQILTENGEVVAFGHFVGQAKSGEPLEVGFCDRLIFESDSIRKRKTYFFQPAL